MQSNNFMFKVITLPISGLNSGLQSNNFLFKVTIYANFGLKVDVKVTICF